MAKYHPMTTRLASDNLEICKLNRCTPAQRFFTALSLMAASWLIALLFALGFPVILMRTPLEEQMLIEAFGDDYRAYMKHTGRYFPRI